MTDYECPKCKEYKKVNDKLLERYLQLVAKVDPEIPDMTFTQQMDIILERLKKIFFSRISTINGRKRYKN